MKHRGVRRRPVRGFWRDVVLATLREMFFPARVEDETAGDGR